MRLLKDIILLFVWEANCHLKSCMIIILIEWKWFFIRLCAFGLSWKKWLKTTLRCKREAKKQSLLSSSPSPFFLIFFVQVLMKGGDDCRLQWCFNLSPFNVSWDKGVGTEPLASPAWLLLSQWRIVFLRGSNTNHSFLSVFLTFSPTSVIVIGRGSQGGWGK